ncbi:hypothetical protein [Aestuariivirga sp.]|uniref:hypothetical protein n=1 Tax=Aestuariivirga sp. TaxID=2650926 RepID=UPI0039E3FD66
MAPLDPEKSAIMRKGTRESAVALLEDVQRFREILSNPTPDRVTLRHLVAPLRRILIDNDLAKVAGPRIGKIRIKAPNTARLADSWPTGVLGFYIAGGAPIFDTSARDMMVIPVELDEKLDKTQIDKFLLLDAHSFMAQRVLYFQGKWITRLAILEYIGYVAAGIHSPSHDRVISPEQRVLAEIRASAAFEKDNLIFGEKLFRVPPIDEEPAFVCSPARVDVLLWEILSTTHYLSNSPDIAALEAYIKKEMNLP